MEYRNTKQRTELENYLHSIKSHPSAKELYEHQKEVFPNISFSTVYRNLQILIEQGKISKVEVGEEARYDGNLRPHTHLICMTCGKIVDVDQDQSILPTNNHGFKIDSVQVFMYGECEQCQRRK